MENVIFDNNIFTEEKVGKLEGSGLAECIDRGRIEVLGSLTLLDELTPLSIHATDRFTNLLDYVLKITKGRWFNTLYDIASLELSGKARYKYYFIPMSKQKILIKQLNDLMTGKAAFPEELKSQHNRNSDWHRKRLTNIRKTAINLNRKSKEKISDIDFNDFYCTNFRNSAITFLNRNFDPPKKTIDRFIANPSDFPYCHFHLKSYIFINYYAACKHQVRIDKNDREDIAYLAYMNVSDILVSDDTKFLREAFRVFCKDKLLLTLDKFIDYCG